MSAMKEEGAKMYMEAEQILYSNGVDDFYFLQEEEIYENANIQLFLPTKPITKLEDFGTYQSRKQLKRDFIIQGELLHFYIIFNLSPKNDDSENENLSSHLQTILQNSDLFKHLKLNVQFSYDSAFPPSPIQPERGVGGGGGNLGVTPTTTTTNNNNNNNASHIQHHELPKKLVERYPSHIPVLSELSNHWNSSLPPSSQLNNNDNHDSNDINNINNNNNIIILNSSLPPPSSNNNNIDHTTDGDTNNDNISGGGGGGGEKLLLSSSSSGGKNECVAEENAISFPQSIKNIILLHNNEFAIPLSIPVHIRKEFIGKRIKMSVIFTPSGYPQKHGKDIDNIISYLLRPQQLEKLPLTRRADSVFSLLEPLSFRWYDHSCYNRNFITLTVNNTLPDHGSGGGGGGGGGDVIIHDLKVHEATSSLFYIPSPSTNHPPSHHHSSSSSSSSLLSSLLPPNHTYSQTALPPTSSNLLPSSDKLNLYFSINQPTMMSSSLPHHHHHHHHHHHLLSPSSSHSTNNNNDNNDDVTSFEDIPIITSLPISLSLPNTSSTSPSPSTSTSSLSTHLFSGGTSPPPTRSLFSLSPPLLSSSSSSSSKLYPPSTSSSSPPLSLFSSGRSSSPPRSNSGSKLNTSSPSSPRGHIVSSPPSSSLSSPTDRYQSLGNGREVKAITFSEYFGYSLQNSLPVTLCSEDEYNFVISIDPLYELLVKSPHSLPLFDFLPQGGKLMIRTTLLITWKTENMENSIVSFHPIEFPSPQSQELLVTVTTASPAPMNRVFDVSFTITNLSSYPRNLVMSLDSFINPANPSFSKGSKVDGNEDATSLYCLQKSSNIGKVEPKSSKNIILKFIALEEGLFRINTVHITDKDSKQLYILKDPCEIYVLDVPHSHRK